MHLLRRDDVKLLMEKHEGQCVSIFMPTHRAGPEAQQDPIRLRNLLREAEEQLLATGVRAPIAKGLLEPAQLLLRDSLFWRYQSDGLALFLSQGLFRHYCLPLDLKEFVVVTNRFHIKPLLPVLSGDGRFYVLALSQNEVRLLQGTHYSIAEVHPQGIPENLAVALKTGWPSRIGERADRFHGHGVGPDDAKENVQRYFHQIDNGLHELLREEQVPLVLAGVEHLLPIYRETNTYPHLLEEGIAGNPEELSPEKLHQRAWAIVQPLFSRAQEEAVAQYRQSAGTERASCDLQEVDLAAYHGRIRILFVAVGTQRWGTFDPDTKTVRLHQEAEPGDEDLLDFATLHTLMNGGTVYAVEPGRVPDDAPVAAVFRY
jgi:hypothetical protein